jgi:hypothetical protein
MKYPSFEKREEGPCGKGCQLLASERSLGGGRENGLAARLKRAAEKA